MNLQSLHVFAATVWGEARGEPPEGQAAVAHVILARARRPGWPDQVWEVCLEPRQFSCWNPDDPNYIPVHTVSVEEPAYVAALHVATGCLIGALSSPMVDADHYHAHSVQPSWADRMRHVGDTAGHRYYDFGRRP